MEDWKAFTKEDIDSTAKILGRILRIDMELMDLLTYEHLMGNEAIKKVPKYVYAKIKALMEERRELRRQLGVQEKEIGEQICFYSPKTKITILPDID